MFCDTKGDQPSTLAGVAAQMGVPSEERTVWDSSLFSLKSSKVKGGHHINCKKDLLWDRADESECKSDTNHAPMPKIVGDLGGSITSHGSSCTHAITGIVRRTITFCTALCSGAWKVSPDWWKTSFREGRSVDESLFVLQHEDFEPKYRFGVEDAVFRAEASRHALLKGYDVCIDHHVQPPVDTLMPVWNLLVEMFLVDLKT
ncbi:uncharacterized protein [Aristolochia californica]|uniref:uncharacterized protein n=1 Tax=Aristolochia californica TaxID=171875 RepID=UPI0035E37C83